MSARKAETSSGIARVHFLRDVDLRGILAMMTYSPGLASDSPALCEYTYGAGPMTRAATEAPYGTWPTVIKLLKERFPGTAFDTDLFAVVGDLNDEPASKPLGRGCRLPPRSVRRRATARRAGPPTFAHAFSTRERNDETPLTPRGSSVPPRGFEPRSPP